MTPPLPVSDRLPESFEGWTALDPIYTARPTKRGPGENELKLPENYVEFVHAFSLTSRGLCCSDSKGSERHPVRSMTPNSGGSRGVARSVDQSLPLNSRGNRRGMHPNSRANLRPPVQPGEVLNPTGKNGASSFRALMRA